MQGLGRWVRGYVWASVRPIKAQLRPLNPRESEYLKPLRSLTTTSPCGKG
jgi:hypothetical protein